MDGLDSKCHPNIVIVFLQDVDYTINGTDDYGANEWEHQDQPQVQALITW